MANYAFDLHIHSCLSPCAENSSLPADMAGLFALSGIKIAALTDHNSCGNCGAFMKACEHYGILGLPGMELSTSEEVHVICLFPELSAAMDFSELVYKSLPDIKNRTELFGNQLYADEAGNILGEEEKLLISASSIGIYDVKALAEKYKGTAYPAHIDRSSNSLLSNLGLWDSHMGFGLAELSLSCPEDLLKKRRDLKGINTIKGSDSHRFEQIPQAPFQAMDIPELSAKCVISWIKSKNLTVI